MKLFINIYVFTMGIIFGSFFNVCIFRIPEKKSICNPPSHCTSCNTRLKPLDLVPVLSYLISGRKCRYCGEKISSRYAKVEILAGLLFLLIYNNFGIQLETVYYLFLASLLIIITFIDLDHYIIPDGIIIIGSIVAIIANIMGYGVGIKDALFGSVICGGGMLLLVYLIGFIVKKEVMGGGDIKLFAMMGLFLGIKSGLLTIMFSIYLGAIYGIAIILHSKIKNREYNSMIPYGPFISVGALIVLLYGNNILSWYSSLFI